ncbi:MAG: ribonuclease HII, partial [Alphaproteobacteria bacterium]|nr:ribonuclease HII [Alphaproteobacteria bacterium]
AICASALAVSVASAPAATIDAINIRQATFEAMRRALAGLAIPPVFALIDGRDAPPGLVCRAQAIIKGDARSLSIAAASIIAKTARDALMARAALDWPHYGFEQHMGYPAPAHLQALMQFGPCTLHRQSFAPVQAAARLFTAP